MIFDILSSRLNVSKWQGQKGLASLSFDVVPNGRECLDIGEDHILCAAGYLPMRDKKRTPIEASVTITSDAERISHVKGEKPFIGYAQFSLERMQDLEPQSAKLWITIVVEPVRFAELLNLRITAPATATLQTEIEGLEFGWEPDGSHRVWNLDDTSDTERADRRRVTDFWVNVETFWTHEQAIQEAHDIRQNILLAQSPDEDDRKLAATLIDEKASDPIVKLLKQCRILLIVLVGLGILLLMTSH